MKNGYRLIAKSALIATLFTLSSVASGAEKYGIYELIHRSDAGFEETLAAVATALDESELVVHASHAVRVPEGKQSAHVFILTSPTYQSLAADESPRTISAQVLRVAVYTWGDEQQTLVNMANPLAHAMVYYAKSDNYSDMLQGAKAAAAEIRSALNGLSGEAVSVQQAPLRTEKHYRKFKGDGPARMMAKFRTYRKSQLLIHETEDQSVAVVADAVQTIFKASRTFSVSKPVGWENLVRIPFGDDAVYFGISNPYLEDKMIRINSRFRSDGKSDAYPYPGTDHVAALPTEVLVIKEEGETKVLHYGQMWRMQLYFWDSGYRAFTANVGVPSSVSNSIESLLEDGLE